MNIYKILFLFFLPFLYQLPANAEINARIIYTETSSRAEEVQKEFLLEDKVMDTALALINDNFKLSHSLTFIIGGDDGPLFNPETNEIVIPYSFIDEVRGRFNTANYEETGVTSDRATQDALIHTVFHEFAHAIINMYELPVLGKEEDAADALATVLLIEFFENGQEIALSAADLFDIESEDTDLLTDEDFWDEHSLDDQRYFSILCHIYGSAPDQYSEFIESNLLSSDRAESCIEEYEVVRSSWFKLLEPYFRYDHI